MKNCVIKGKKGFLTIKHNNKIIYSMYNPYKEAENYLSIVSLKPNVITVCGLDYINELLTFNEEINHIIAYDPLNIDNIWVKDKKIFRASSVKEIEIFLNTKMINTNDLSIIIWPKLLDLDKKTIKTSIDELKTILYKNSLSKTAEIKLTNIENSNLIKNITKLKKANFIESSTTKEIATIISSGNSLQNHIEDIQKLQKYSYIFSLPSALAYLQKNNIIPDGVIACDPGFPTFFHLYKYTKKTTLFIPLTVDSNILYLKNYKKLFFSYNTDIEKIILHNNIINSNSEGSVIFTAINLLQNLKFTKIILIGQDFSFYENKFHIQGGSFESELLKNSNYYNGFEQRNYTLSKKLQHEKIIHNEKIYKTTLPLKIYYDHFINNYQKNNIFTLENSFLPTDNIHRLQNININKKSIDEIIKFKNIEIKTLLDQNINLIKKYFKNNKIIEKLYE